MPLEFEYNHKVCDHKLIGAGQLKDSDLYIFYIDNVGNLYRQRYVVELGLFNSFIPSIDSICLSDNLVQDGFIIRIEDMLYGGFIRNDAKYVLCYYDFNNDIFIPFLESEVSAYVKVQGKWVLSENLYAKIQGHYVTLQDMSVKLFNKWSNTV